MNTMFANRSTFFMLFALFTSLNNLIKEKRKEQSWYSLRSKKWGTRERDNNELQHRTDHSWGKHLLSISKSTKYIYRSFYSTTVGWQQRTISNLYRTTVVHIARIYHIKTIPKSKIGCIYSTILTYHNFLNNWHKTDQN